MAPANTANLTRDTTTDRKTLPRFHQFAPRATATHSDTSQTERSLAADRFPGSRGRALFQRWSEPVRRSAANRVDLSDGSPDRFNYQLPCSLPRQVPEFRGDTVPGRTATSLTCSLPRPRPIRFVHPTRRWRGLPKAVARSAVLAACVRRAGRPSGGAGFASPAHGGARRPF
jgi:hypothetical protein